MIFGLTPGLFLTWQIFKYTERIYFNSVTNSQHAKLNRCQMVQMCANIDLTAITMHNLTCQSSINMLFILLNLCGVFVLHV